MVKATSNATLSIKETDAIRKTINKRVGQKVKSSYSRIESSIQDLVQEMARKQLMSSNVIQSVLAGRLKSDFGLSQGMASGAVKEIIEYISNNIEVSFQPSNKTGSVATFSLNLLPMGVRGLTSLPEGNYSSTGKFGGGDVSWLTWLLTRGTQILIGDFFVFDNPEGKTRSGESVMQKVGKGSKPFRIDPGFSGTEDDNFVTRALNPIIPQVKQTIFSKIKEGLK